jgi:death on curing protein
MAIRYLTTGEVVAINEAEVGPNLLADFGLLESAVLRPQQSAFGADAYPDVHTKAAALFHSLVKNHAFVDGNKRTSVLATLTFYGLNGWWVNADQDAIVALAVEAAAGRLDVEAIAERLKRSAHPIEGEPPRPLLVDARYFCGSGGGLTSMPRASSASGDQPASSP